MLLLLQVVTVELPIVLHVVRKEASHARAWFIGIEQNVIDVDLEHFRSFENEIFRCEFAKGCLTAKIKVGHESFLRLDSSFFH